MNTDKHTLTPAEWYVMEALWKKPSCTGREAVESLASSANWSRSTTLTMLRRMTDKGLLCCAEKNGVLTYSPLISQEEATQQETTDFLDRVYHGSISMMLSAFARKQPLSPQEIHELYAILDEIKGAKENA